MFKSDAYRRFVRVAGSTEDFLAFVMFVALGTVVFLQFFTRYVLNDPFGWTEEIARYLLIGTTFFGCMVGTRHNAHIKLELTEKIFPPRWVLFIANRLIPFISLLLLLYLTWSAFSLTMLSSRKMTSLPSVPLTVVYIPVMGCLIAMALHNFAALIAASQKQ